MTRIAVALGLAVLVLAEPALAQPGLGSAPPRTLWHALLAGAGNPVIRIVPLAAVLAVGCLIAAQTRAALPVASYAFASIIGASAHVGETTVDDLDVVLAVAVVALGLVAFRTTALRRDIVVALTAAVGLVNGYALGEPIAGADREPILAYLAGLAAINVLLAVVAIYAVRGLHARPAWQMFATRLIGAFAVGAGVALLMQRYGA